MMFRKNPHAAEVPKVAEGLSLTDPSVPLRSCCCPARPTVKVTMPPTAGRTHPVDLWLCGHHYRASLAALLAAEANVEKLTMPAEHPQADHATATGRPAPGSPG